MINYKNIKVMKKIIILFAFLLMFLVSHFTYSQYSLPIRLVSSTGTPDVGEASNIAFTRYPHSYPTDAVSGITVTEIGTAGNYRCRGFTTFEYVKLWLSGVEQTWFDSVRVGDVTSYMLSNYISKTTTQTGISGTKALTGDWTWTSGNITLNKPYLYGSSTWQSDYSLPTSSSLVWRGFADSIYGIKKWWVDNFKVRLYTGYKWYGSTSAICAIPIDASELTYDETTGLGVGTNQDSTVFPDVTVKYDSTDGSENTYSKTYNFYQPNYKHPVWDSLGGLKVEYERITNGSLISEFEAHVLNNAWFDELEKAANLTTTDVIIDTLTLPRPGQYQITSVFTVNFANWNGSNCTDSVLVSIDDGSLPGSSRIATQLVTHRYNATVETGGAVNVTVTTTFYRQGQNNVIYLYAKLYNATSSQTHQIWKTQSTAINIY